LIAVLSDEFYISEVKIAGSEKSPEATPRARSTIQLNSSPNNGSLVSAYRIVVEP
jgi:hypothetical protein